MSLALQSALLDGIGIGSVYAVVALAYSFVLRTTGAFNFAQGQLVTLGALLAYTLWGQVHVPLVIAIGITTLLVGLVGLLTERLAIWPLARRGDAQNTWLISTLGAGILITGAAERIWGTQPLGVANFLSLSSVRIGDAHISSAYVATVIVAGAMYCAVEMVQRYTFWGLVMRATASNRDAVTLAGVNVVTLGAVTFALGGAIAGLAGFVAAPVTYAVSTSGFTLSLLAFAGLTIGGMASHWGALIGSLLVGVVQSLGGVYLGGSYANVLVFGVLIGVLLIRPEGLLSRRARHV